MLSATSSSGLGHTDNADDAVLQQAAYTRQVPLLASWMQANGILGADTDPMTALDCAAELLLSPTEAAAAAVNIGSMPDAPDTGKAARYMLSQMVSEADAALPYAADSSDAALLQQGIQNVLQLLDVETSAESAAAQVWEQLAARMSGTQQPEQPQQGQRGQRHLEGLLCAVHNGGGLARLASAVMAAHGGSVGHHLACVATELEQHRSDMAALRLVSHVDAWMSLGAVPWCAQWFAIHFGISTVITGAACAGDQDWHSQSLHMMWEWLADARVALTSHTRPCHAACLAAPAARWPLQGHLPGGYDRAAQRHGPVLEGRQHSAGHRRCAEACCCLGCQRQWDIHAAMIG